MREVGPTLAELARTAVARACVATLTSCGRGYPPEDVLAVVRVHDQPDGRPVVEVDRGSPLVRQLAVHRVVTVSVAAPPPFAALHLSGPAQPTDATGDGLCAYRLSLLSLHFVGATAAPVSLREYYGAEPDPLWPQAARTVGHLEDAHAEDLLACVRAHGARQVEAVLPRTIDRHGLELALITASGVRTVRLSFPDGPVTSLAQLNAGLRTVLTCRCGSTYPGADD